MVKQLRITTITITRDIWKELKQLQLNLNMRRLSDVIQYLLKNVGNMTSSPLIKKTGGKELFERMFKDLQFEFVGEEGEYHKYSTNVDEAKFMEIEEEGLKVGLILSYSIEDRPYIYVMESVRIKEDKEPRDTQSNGEYNIGTQR